MDIIREYIRNLFGNKANYLRDKSNKPFTETQQTTRNAQPDWYQQTHT